MALGTNQITTTTAANYLRTLWSKEVKVAMEPHLVFANNVFRINKADVKKNDTLKIPSLASMSANDKSANTQVTLQVTTEGTNTLSLNKHKESSVVIEDFPALQTAHDLRKLYTEQEGKAIRKVVDSDLSALLASGWDATKGDGDSDLGDTLILESMILLDNADVPDTDRVLIVKPAQYAALIKIDKFTDASKVGEKKPSPVKSYQIGEIYGCPTYKSTNVNVTGNVAYNCLMHKQAIILGMQLDPRVQSAYVLEYLGDLVVTDVVYGVLRYRTDFAVPILSRSN